MLRPREKGFLKEIIDIKNSEYSAVGSAPALGVGSRVFESHYSEYRIVAKW